MAKNTPQKMSWAVAATWRRYSLHRVRGDAENALQAWKEAREAEGFVVKGTKSRSYTASEPNGPAKQSAGIIKLADHPLCYIGVIQSDVEVLRRLESEENPAFEEYSARAKAISEGWTQVEAL